jgi:hypothetical protein
MKLRVTANLWRRANDRETFQDYKSWKQAVLARGLKTSMFVAENGPSADDDLTVYAIEGVPNEEDADIFGHFDQELEEGILCKTSGDYVAFLNENSHDYEDVPAHEWARGSDHHGRNL